MGRVLAMSLGLRPKESLEEQASRLEAIATDVTRSYARWRPSLLGWIASQLGQRLNGTSGKRQLGPCDTDSHTVLAVKPATCGPVCSGILREAKRESNMVSSPLRLLKGSVPSLCGLVWLRVKRYSLPF